MPVSTVCGLDRLRLAVQYDGQGACRRLPNSIEPIVMGYMFKWLGACTRVYNNFNITVTVIKHVIIKS